MTDFRLYRLLDTLFPASFKLKLFFVAFVGVHVPLAALLTTTLLSSRPVAELEGPLLVVMLAATLVGTVLTIVGIHLVLKPVEAATAALSAYEARREILPLPVRFADESGQLMRSVDGLVGTMEALLQRQEEEAVTDALTGLANRRGFQDGFRAAVVHRPADAPASLVVVDIDHFKTVNDSYGHIAGDTALAAVGRMLAQEAGPDAVVARYGGEEFLVFLPGQDIDAAARLADRLRLGAAALPFEAFPRLSLTISAGVAGASLRDIAFDDVYERADRALYRAKREGRNRVALAGANELVQPEEIDWAVA
jgi:diguanylate cyclase (GGDEF)-like protein